MSNPIKDRSRSKSRGKRASSLAVNPETPNVRITNEETVGSRPSRTDMKSGEEVFNPPNIIAENAAAPKAKAKAKARAKARSQLVDASEDPEQIPQQKAKARARGCKGRRR